MSLRSIGGGSRDPPISNGDILRSGLLKKLRSYRKKWFVLRDETPDTLARLEYYDSEKTFRRGSPPKRSIALKTCFNINRRQDTKYKHVIALYTKDDCLCIVLEKLEEFQAWLEDMLRLQQGEEIPKGVIPKPKYEHVWQVYVCRLFLGEEICGYYRLCLSEVTLSLVRLDNIYTIDMDLGCIRSCIQYKNFIHLELGRSSMLGEGHLWIEADDKNVAFYMNKTIYQRMKAYRERNRGALLDRVDILPIARIRSSSATEASKSNSSAKKFWFPFSSKPNQQPQDNQTHSNSESSVIQPTTSVPTTSIGGGSSIIHHQRTQSLPLASPTTVVPAVDNNNTGNVANHSPITNNTPVSSSTTTTATSTTATITHPSCSSVTGAKRPSQSSKCFRDRCESMPCRPRTSSEGNHSLPPWVRHGLIPHRSHMRDVSHSPPTGSPMSPPSDSTGSSYSLPDDNECCTESEPQQRIYNVPITPDEAIAEEECTDSPIGNQFSEYMSMGGPQSVDDGFQDMLPLYNNRHHSNNTSMNSVKSGTPSTDIRFSDYPLDKVISYLTDDDNTRPARAWSVGSKPPGAAGESADSTRTRAFSVGSKTKKIMGRILPHYSHPGVKSSSAPILSNHRAPSSSVGPMGDLMEMDFTVPRSRTSTNESKNSSSSSCNHRNSSCASNKRTPPGYLEMKCGEMLKMNGMSPYVDMNQRKKSNEGYVDMSCGSAAMSGYMDMSGNSSSPKQNPVSQTIVDTARYLARASSRDDYVDMEANNRRSRTNSKNYSAAKTATSPGYQWPTPTDYLDMSGGSNRRDRSSFSSQLSSSPNINSISPKSDFMSLGFGHNFTIPERMNHTPDGYVEMTPGHINKHQRQSSLDGSRSTDEYLDMSGGSKKSDKTTVNKDRVKSQPVSIQTTSNNQTVKISSPITISSLLGRKNSTGTPPRMHLPLTSWASSSPYASLPRQKPRKNSSSKDSSTSNSVTTTPSSSSTMFPLSLNSPSSPASNTGTPTTTKIPPTILNIPYKKPISYEFKKYAEDYTVMDFEKNAEKKRKDMAEYANFCPGTVKAMKLPEETKSEEYGDYAVMAPTKVQQKLASSANKQVSSSLIAGRVVQATKSPQKQNIEYDDYAVMAPLAVTPDTAKSNTLPLRKGDTTKTTSLLSSHLSDVDLKEDRSGFKPINEAEQRLRGFSPTSGNNQVPSSSPTGGKPQEAATPKEAEESPYETLRRNADLQAQSSKGARPKSSNSERTKSPRSSSSDIHSRPSSVCSESSRLGSTSSVCSGSSGSTLIGSSSRPESVNSDRTASGSTTNADRGVQLQTVQLHYASLDLAQPDDSSKSPRLINSSPGEVNLNDQPTFVYADIDFVRSEEFKNSGNVPSISTNTKVK